MTKRLIVVLLAVAALSGWHTAYVEWSYHRSVAATSVVAASGAARTLLRAQRAEMLSSDISADSRVNAMMACTHFALAQNAAEFSDKGIGVFNRAAAAASDRLLGRLNACSDLKDAAPEVVRAKLAEAASCSLEADSPAYDQCFE